MINIYGPNSCVADSYSMAVGWKMTAEEGRRDGGSETKEADTKKRIITRPDNKVPGLEWGECK